MKKDELRKDPVRENIIKGVQYLSDNNSIVISILTGLVLVIGIYSYLQYTNNVKSENSSHLSGRAQNIYFNGNIDEAIVKFERVINDYPKTNGSIQSLIYLISDAVKNGDNKKAEKLLTDHSLKSNDPIITSHFYNLKGDLALDASNYNDAIKYYEKSSALIQSNVKSKINLAEAYIMVEKYNKAKNILQPLTDNDDINYNDKNLVEELLSFVDQKANI